MARKPVTLSNGKAWETQGAAEQHFRDLRDRYPLNTPIDDVADHDDLSALLERYDLAILDGASKIGCGIDHFEVRMNYMPNRGSTKGFWVVRTDGSETDFSFISAVKGEPKAQAQEFADACRAAVAADLVKAKKTFFEEYGGATGVVPCEMTDAPITQAEAHLDHAFPTFGQLVVTFRAARGWHAEIPQGVLTRAQDGQTTTTFTDPEVAKAFMDFHHAAATLRIVAKGKNLSMAAGARRPKIKRPVRL
jgi:hypothetical protein